MKVRRDTVMLFAILSMALCLLSTVYIFGGFNYRIEGYNHTSIYETEVNCKELKEYTP